MTLFKHTRTVAVGGIGSTRKILMGGNNPVSIQTMWKESLLPILSDSNAFYTLQKKCENLESLGCDVLRFAVPDMESAEALLKLAECVHMPLVADIHFDHKLALRCMDGKIAKIRINPGNIGSEEKRREVIKKAHDCGIAMRIGVNSGSLPKDLESAVSEGILSRAAALSQTALRELEIFEKHNFTAVVVSMKASNVAETIEANEYFATQSDVPLHIGVTEAGPLIAGVVKSTLVFNRLLNKDIGATVRVSLSSTPENEVITAREILRESGKRSGGVRLVSCPRCGRDGFDVHDFVERWQTELLSLNKDITVAVMGCAVNGPGEGRHADIGITGAGNSVLIFKRGKIVRTVSPQDADVVFREELNSL